MKRRHKTILICCIIYILFFSVTALFLPLPDSVPENVPSQTVYAAAETSQDTSGEEKTAHFSTPVQKSAESERVVWRLAEISGSIQVLHGSECVFVTAIEPATLRTADRLLLQQGVAAASLEEILMLIEDLGS